MSAASLYTHVARYCGIDCQQHDRPRLHRYPRTEPVASEAKRIPGTPGPVRQAEPMTHERRTAVYLRVGRLTQRQLRQLYRGLVRGYIRDDRVQPRIETSL